MHMEGCSFCEVCRPQQSYVVLEGFCAMQVRTLSELGWFLTTGTLAQLFALVVVVVKLFMSPLQGKPA